MEIQIPTQEGDHIPVPLSSSTSYAAQAAAAASHILHHHHPEQHQNHHMIPSSAPLPPPPTSNNNNNGAASNNDSHDHDHDAGHPHHAIFKKVGVVVRYKECLKNHAAAMGGNTTDGCGEFMPSGVEGSMEALTCSACNCHRNFHRKEVEGDHHQLLSAGEWAPYGHSPQHLNRVGRKVILGGGGHHHKNMLPHEALVYPTAALIASRGPTPHQMIMPYNMAGSLPSESDDQEDGGGGCGGGGLMVRPPHHLQMVRPPHHLQMVKKRFRTKFTQEQKEKMLNFAEKVGWKIQRQEESVVQQFCQEIGVKRRVLKVWMHNNKLNLAKKNLNDDNNISP